MGLGLDVGGSMSDAVLAHDSSPSCSWLPILLDLVYLLLWGPCWLLVCYIAGGMGVSYDFEEVVLVNVGMTRIHVVM